MQSFYLRLRNKDQNSVHSMFSYTSLADMQFSNVQDLKMYSVKGTVKKTRCEISRHEIHHGMKIKA